jgi:recombinational DNA repair protein (RecF pathway)
MVCGDKSSPRFSNVQNGSKCLKCANRESGINRRTPEDIAVSQMQIAGLKPLVPFEGTKIPWKSECSTCGKTVTPTLGNVIQGHVGCGYCSGSIVDVEEANQVMQEANLEPLVPFPGADKPWLSKHKICGQKVKPSYSSIRRGQGGCKSCGSAEGGRKNLFPSDKAIDLMRNANYLPLESYIKADLPWRCECLKCHKVVYPTLSNVKSGHSKCIYCSKMKVDPEDAIALMRKFGFEPLEPYVDSKKKWKCLHLKCGNIVNPLYNSIQNRKSGCSFCAEYGLKFNEPAYLYIMEHMDYSSIKVGISNEQARPNRIKSHEKEGWVLRKKINFESGLLADYVETQILLWLRNVRKLGIHLSKDMMKQGGYSETVDSAEIDFLQIQRQVESISNSLFKIE